MLHIRLIYANKNFLLTYLLTYRLSTVQQLVGCDDNATIIIKSSHTLVDDVTRFVCCCFSLVQPSQSQSLFMLQMANQNKNVWMCRPNSNDMVENCKPRIDSIISMHLRTDTVTISSPGSWQSAISSVKSPLSWGQRSKVMCAGWRWLSILHDRQWTALPVVTSNDDTC